MATNDDFDAAWDEAARDVRASLGDKVDFAAWEKELAAAALRAVDDYPLNGTYEVGLTLRRSFRALLDQLGTRWIEHCGLLCSTFVVTAPERTHDKIRRAITG